MKHKPQARFTSVSKHTRTSVRGRKFGVTKHKRKLSRFRKRKVKRRRVPRLIKPEVSQAIHELSKDEVEYSGAFDFNPNSPKIENAVLREGDTWSVTLPPSEVRIKYPDLFEEYDRDFEVTWHTHPKGGFPYLPSPTDIVGIYRDSAVLGQENHLVYVDETKSVFVITIPRATAKRVIKEQNKDLDKWERELNKDWNQYNHLPIPKRIPARKKMMKRWAKKYNFKITEVPIDDPIVVHVIPEEPNRVKRRI